MTTALLVKNTCTLIFSPFQEMPGFYVKVEGEEAPEGSQILGTPTVEPAGARGQPAIDKRAQWPPPASPPPVLPRHLTCPSNMSPTMVGLLRSTIVTVSTSSIILEGCERSDLIYYVSMHSSLGFSRARRLWTD